MMYFGEAWRLLKLFSPDFILWATSCVVTVFWGAMEGESSLSTHKIFPYFALPLFYTSITRCCAFVNVLASGVAVSVALSLIWLLKKSAFPSTAVLGRLPGTIIFRNIKRFPMAQEIPGVKILRFDASLNFSNADQFETSIVKTAKLDAGKEGFEEENGGPVEQEIKVVIIDASSINDVDVTAIRSDAREKLRYFVLSTFPLCLSNRMLQNVAKRMHLSGRVMLFANWKGPMRDFLDRAHFYDTVRPEHCFLSLLDAVQWAEEFYLKEDGPTQDGSVGFELNTPIASDGSTGQIVPGGRPSARSVRASFIMSTILFSVVPLCDGID